MSRYPLRSKITKNRPQKKCSIKLVRVNALMRQPTKKTKVKLSTEVIYCNGKACKKERPRNNQF